MTTDQTCDFPTTESGPRNSVSLATRFLGRLPKRTLTQSRQLQTVDQPFGVTVRRYPSLDRTCRHQVFLEDQTGLKRIDLPATGRIEVCQRFGAKAGDVVSLEYVIWLQRGSSPDASQTSLSIDLRNLERPICIPLVSHNLATDNTVEGQRVASQSRQAASCCIEVDGTYELRITTSVDASCAGSSAHLLTDAVQVADARGTTKIKLASVCCVGSVQRANFEVAG